MSDDEATPTGTGPRLNRRELLTLGAATAAFAGGVGLIPAVMPRLAEALPPPPGEEVLHYGFGVDIPDAPEASSGIRDVTFENIEVQSSNGPAPKRKKVPLSSVHLTVEAGSPAAVRAQPLVARGGRGQVHSEEHYRHALQVGYVRGAHLRAVRHLSDAMVVGELRHLVDRADRDAHRQNRPHRIQDVRRPAWHR